METWRKPANVLRRIQYKKEVMQDFEACHEIISKMSPDDPEYETILEDYNQLGIQAGMWTQEEVEEGW